MWPSTARVVAEESDRLYSNQGISLWARRVFPASADSPHCYRARSAKRARVSVSVRHRNAPKLPTFGYGGRVLLC